MWNMASTRDVKSRKQQPIILFSVIISADLGVLVSIQYVILKPISADSDNSPVKSCIPTSDTQQMYSVQMGGCNISAVSVCLYATNRFLLKKTNTQTNKQTKKHIYIHILQESVHVWLQAHPQHNIHSGSTVRSCNPTYSVSFCSCCNNYLN